MKHLKTKLGLSVLALACLGAGVFSLQPTVSASANDATNASGLVMSNGAMVRVAKDWSGIRWETTVKAGTYAEDAVFGVIVAPTKSITGELTHENSDCELDLVATNFTTSESEDTKYYSAINYDNLADEQGIDLAQAYKLELTARAYVKVNGEYQYADLSDINTSRSARQVAIAAELDGALVDGQEGAFKYYGAEKYTLTEEQKNTGAVGTPVIDLENPTQTVTVTGFAIEGTIEEVLVGGERVEATYADGTLTITEANNAATGEVYATIITDQGIYTKPVIGATKVITTVDDLKTFNAKGKGATVDGEWGGKYTTQVAYKDDYWAPEQEQSGYYVLGQNIEAEGYVHGSKNDEGAFNNNNWNSSAKHYKGLPIGLTGTFNGMGYAIKDMEIGSKREGFFGIVNSGTVKNVAFTEVKSNLTEYAYVLAYYLFNATIENVYIKTDAYEADSNGDGVAESVGFPLKMSAGLAYSYYGHNTMKSCVVEISLSAESGGDSAADVLPTGILFTALDEDENFADKEDKVSLTCDEVYCISNNKLKRYTQMLMYVAKEGSGDSMKRGEIMLGENDKQDDYSSITVYRTNANGEYINEAGEVVAKASKAETLVYTHGNSTYDHFVLDGAYRYNRWELMIEAGKSCDSLNAGGCWTVVDGVPVWNSLNPQA